MDKIYRITVRETVMSSRTIRVRARNRKAGEDLAVDHAKGMVFDREGGAKDYEAIGTSEDLDQASDPDVEE